MIKLEALGRGQQIRGIIPNQSVTIVDVGHIPTPKVKARPPRYVRRPKFNEPDRTVLSVNYDLKELLSRSHEAY